jgi:hypothetical protein
VGRTRGVKKFRQLLVIGQETECRGRTADGKIKGHIDVNFNPKNKYFNPHAMWPVIHHP